MKATSQNNNKKFVDVLCILGKLNLPVLVRFALSTSAENKLTNLTGKFLVKYIDQ
jgi:hypothetical protein